MFDILAVTEILGPIESGATEPFRCRLEDEQLYAVKGRGALVSGLISEAVCAELGRRLGLPIPEWSLVEVPEELVDAVSDPLFQRAIGAGTAFGSLWIEPAIPLSRASVTGSDSRCLALIYAFDHWVMNGDRTLTELGGNPNLLLDLKSKTIVAIDHNLAFSSRYTPIDLQTHAGRDRWLDANRDMLFKDACRARFVELLPDVPAILDALPEEWADAAPGSAQHILDCLDRAQSDAFWDEME